MNLIYIIQISEKFQPTRVLIVRLLSMQMSEFSGKMRSVMPEVPKREPRGKSDFKSVQELIDYILEEDEKHKKNG